MIAAKFCIQPSRVYLGQTVPPRWRLIRATDAGKQVTDFLNCQIINFSSAPKLSSTAHIKLLWSS